jgi:predicted DNA binding protein
MISKTYVNEIDVSKVKAGQEVRLSVDAFPDKTYTGSVISVANIGEQLPNTDAKVFEVITKVDGSDPILRPSMTTGNQIITQTFKDVIYIPLETVFATADSVPFVYRKDGTRQIVMLGESNENFVIVEQGLKKGEKLYLSIPEEGDKFKLEGEELIAAIKERKKQQLEEQKRQQNANPRAGVPSNMTPEQMREYMQSLTPEQREAMRQMRGAGGQGMAPGTGTGARQVRPGGTRPDTATTQQRVVIRNQ